MVTFDTPEQERIYTAASNGTLGDTTELQKLRVDHLFALSDSWLARAGVKTDGRGTKAIIAILAMAIQQVKRHYEASLVAEKMAKVAPKPSVVKTEVV